MSLDGSFDAKCVVERPVISVGSNVYFDVHGDGVLTNCVLPSSSVVSSTMSLKFIELCARYLSQSNTSTSSLPLPVCCNWWRLCVSRSIASRTTWLFSAVDKFRSFKWLKFSNSNSCLTVSGSSKFGTSLSIQKKCGHYFLNSNSGAHKKIWDKHMDGTVYIQTTSWWLPFELNLRLKIKAKNSTESLEFDESQSNVDGEMSCGNCRP